MLTRRQFNRGLAACALSGLALNISKVNAFSKQTTAGYGPLVPDPKGILDLPANFSYEIISKLDQVMDDGLTVPDCADGMGCISIDEDHVALIRNHELSSSHDKIWDVEFTPEQKQMAYDSDKKGKPLSGGTSTMIYNLKTGQVDTQFMSLLGTIRNCAGGITPWGSWLSCEESVEKATGGLKKDHGYVFEVPANAKGLVEPSPIKAMGRFNHEAACVDPKTNIVYLTEDRYDSLFYRFIPNQAENLHAGGKLQALAIKNKAKFDTRNWEQVSITKDQSFECEWIDLDNVESPKDDLRERGHKLGAALFARGEGIIFGEDELYFCCTNGGAKKLGQIMRYSTKQNTISLFLESHSKAAFNYGDNVCIAPNSHLVVCEDQYLDTVNNHIKGVDNQGLTYDIAKVRWQTEPAGTCFSPDGSILFVNLYSPTATLAIRGPWQSLT